MAYIQERTQAKPHPVVHLSTQTGAAGPGRPGHGLASIHSDMDENAGLSAQELVKSRTYSDLDIRITEEDSAFWCFMNPQERPSFTRQLLTELADVQLLIKSLLSARPKPFEYVVLGSRTAGLFNLGGDLALFAEKIRQGDYKGLKTYARACVAVGYANHTGYGNGAITIALVQGDALGGGFESALSCDLIVAERQAKFGLPEVLFNLYPGMGAYSFLSRRVGMMKAEQIILSGRTYTAEEMLELGAIDMVVEPGEGETSIREYIAQNRSRRTAASAIYKVRRRVDPVSLEELNDIADLWVDTAFELTEQDLRRMTRIAAAQDRLRSRIVESDASKTG